MKKQVAIIGNLELVIECAKLIQEQGFEISCLFSETLAVKEWATTQYLTVIEDINSFFEFLKRKRVDYLFSIQNPFIIPNEVLNSINKLAINYHNTLLPRYGGTRNNAGWVIWFGEQENGITWHTMNNLIDGGNILKQPKFLLDENETAFSLELKCQESAKQALKELLMDLSLNKIEAKPQDLSKRSFFYSYSRPCGFAVIDWNNLAKHIWQQFRAFNFGTQLNPIALLKFKIKEKYFAILEMTILQSKTDCVLPGTIIDIKNTKLQVATQSFDLLITYQPLSFNSKDTLIIEKGNLLEQEKLPLTHQIEIAENIAKDEILWRNDLQSFAPGKNFIQSSYSFYDNYVELTKFKFNELFSNSSTFTLENLLTIILGYLYKLNNYEDFSLCIGGSIVQLPNQSLNGLLLEVKPLSTNFNHIMEFSTIREKVKDLLNSIRKRKACFKDLLLRDSKCKDNLLLNSLLLNFSSNVPSTYTSYYPIIINVDENNQFISLLIANTYRENMPFFLNFIKPQLKKLSKNWYLSGKKLNQFNLLSKAELHYLHIWNDTTTYYPKNSSIPELIDKVCNNFSSKIALESKDRKITYQELKLNLEQTAKNLLYSIKSNGIQTKQVGVFLDKSIDTIIMFLAILKAGLAYIVLDTTYPDSYLENIISSSQAKLFISLKDNVDRLKQIVAKVIDPTTTIFLEAENLLNEKKDNKLPINISSKNLAYILFTSGSTGIPKGVMISQRSVINLAYGVISNVKIINSDRVLQFSTLAFDASVWEIYATLLAGGTLYIPNRPETHIGKHLEETLINKEISILMLSPSALSIQTYFKSHTLKAIIAAGEACSQHIVDQWGKHYRLINGYGPTECTVFTTMSQPLVPGQEITIGKPIQNYQVTICDSYQQQVVLGGIGEIVISGAGIAKGYVNAKLTKDKFKQLNLLGKKKIGYLSGDLGKWTPDGEIYYLSRNDSQVKIRGFRIESKMIEGILTMYKGIISCTIVMNKTDTQENTLHAYLLIDKSTKIKLSLLKDFLKNKLPIFMLPAKFFVTSYFPLTPAGKIDHKKLLSQPGIELLRDEVEYSPITTLQKEIAKIWQEIIGVDYEPDIYATFSEIGGSSLQITQMILKIQKIYNIEISTANFLKQPTIKYLEDTILQSKTSYNKVLSINYSICQDVKEFKQFINFEKLRENNQSKRPPNKIKKVFLTGVTGFLGSYLAKFFLENNIQTYCLVRVDQSKTFTKVENILRSYNWKDEDITKLHFVEGDLNQAKFGLNKQVYEHLSQEIDAICNAAAFVHHLLNYNQLKTANVHSVWNCIELAATYKPKYFTHISTLSLISGLKEEILKNNTEEDFINIEDLSTSDMNGYNATKLAAEVCITETVKNIPFWVKIYRPGWIGGDSTNGTFAYEKNHLFLFIKGCLQLGFAPKWDTLINIIPVDYVAKSIVSNLLFDNQWNKVYNMISPKSINFKDFMTYFAKKTKTKLDFVPYKDWQAEIKNLNPDNAIYPLLPLYLGANNDFIVKTYNLISHAKHSAFLKAYNQLKLPSLPATRKLKPIYGDFLIKKGFFRETNLYN